MRHLAIGAAMAAGLIAAAPAQEMRPALTRATAEKAVAACRALAEREGWRMSIAVTDESGGLVALARMDGAFAKSVEIARLKAETAATTPFSTAALNEYVYRNPQRPHGLELVPGIVVFGGGEPIATAARVRIGAIGVSGSSADNDVRCARAGVEAVAPDLR